MVVRVLYPTAFGEIIESEDEEGEIIKREPEAGQIIELDDEVAEGHIASGAAEAPDAKPPEVEQATAAPGQKRGARGRRKQSA
jgi:beta-lactam-binding protein with PASTA domain